MKYAQGTIKKYLNDLSAKTPAPGGGSVAALSAAAAAGLIIMACSYTLGKDRYKKYEARINKILLRARKIQARLTLLLDQDVKAYMSGDMNKAVRIPSEICFLSCELMELAVEVSKKGNSALFSDVVLAAMLSEASFKAGYLYCFINIRSIKGGAKKYSGLLKRLESAKKNISSILNKAEA